jgi:diguanylate cyclase (GGDEF)-like protein
VYAGLLPYACNTALAIVAPRINASPVGQIVEATVIALVPVSFAVAILGHRLFQVGILVRRGLVFGLTTGVLAASGYLAAVALGGIARDILGLSLTTWGAAALFLVGGVLWQPLARVIAATVDTRFFPERVALGELQRTIIPELAGYTELTPAAEHLTRRLRASLELETATLLMADAHGEWFRPLGWAGDFGDADPRQIAISAAEIAALNGGMTIAAPIEEAEPGPVTWLRAAYAVPIRLSLSDRLTGVLLLGRSVHRRALERDALEMLDAVALQASAMLENARLFALATRDPLTGLLRRHAAMDRLAEEVERCRRTFHPFAVALADLDHFKDVNDTHGHAAGDAVLRSVAEVFASYSRRTDLVARYGGEEFLFLLPDTPAAGARVHAEAVRAQVERNPARTGPGGEPVHVTVSIGVYAVGDPGQLTDPDELVRRADEALYRAKRAGRNRVETASAGPPIGRDDVALARSSASTEAPGSADSVDAA